MRALFPTHSNLGSVADPSEIVLPGQNAGLRIPLHDIDSGFEDTNLEVSAEEDVGTLQPEDFNANIADLGEIRTSVSASDFNYHIPTTQGSNSTTTPTIPRRPTQRRPHRPMSSMDFIQDHVNDALEAIAFWKKHLDTKDPIQAKALKNLYELQKCLETMNPNDLESIEECVEEIQTICYILTENYISHIQNLNTKLSTAYSDVSSLKLQISNLKAEIKSIHTEFQGSVDEKNHLINSLNAKLDDLTKIKAACDAERASVEEKLQSTLDELEATLEAEDSSEEEIEELNSQISALESQIAQLKDPLIIDGGSPEGVTKATSDITFFGTPLSPENATEKLKELATQANAENLERNRLSAEVAKLNEDANALRLENQELKSSVKTWKYTSLGLGAVCLLGGAWLVHKNKA